MPGASFLWRPASIGFDRDTCLLKANCTVSFAAELSHDDAAAIRAYVVFRRNEGVTQQTPAN